MAIDIANYIKDKLRKSGSSIDTRPGSVWSDLVGTPLKYILEDFFSYQDEIVKNQSLLNADVMNDSTADAMAANFLVSRSTGSYAAGGVTLYFTTAQTITIPQGTIFATEEGFEYITTAVYNISSQSMALNRDQYPLYNTDEIPIRARGVGSNYNVAAGSVTKSINWGGTSNKISNINPIVGGQDHESNEKLLDRVRDSVHGPNMSSVTGIKSTLASNFPSLESIDVIGTNNALMTRDLSSLTSLVASYQEEDFYMIYSHLEGPLAKPHKAYWGNFVDLDETASVALPRPDQFSTEFTDAMYEGLFFRDDLYTSDTAYETIVQEYFDTLNVSGEMTPKSLEAVLYSGAWHVHDGQSPVVGDDGKRGKPWNDEFSVTDEGSLRLGKHYDLYSDDFEMQLPYSTLLGLQQLLVETVNTEGPSTGDEDAASGSDYDTSTTTFGGGG